MTWATPRVYSQSNCNPVSDIHTITTSPQLACTSNKEIMSSQRNDPSNDNAQIPPEADNKHNEGLDDEILRRVGWLRGFRVDDVNEPRISSRTVALYKDGASPIIEDSDTNNLLTEFIISKNKRELNYSHRGWSLGATQIMSPWIASRIDANNHPNLAGTYFTKMTKAKRVRVEALLEDLIPAPEFETAMEEALGQPTTFEKFEAVYQAFSRWGDVVPLEIEIGSSIALSSARLESLQSSEINEHEFNNLSQFSTIKDTIVAIKGTDLNLTYDQWAMGNDLVYKNRWQRIAVNKVVPTINLLSSDLRSCLSELYAKRVCYAPRDTVGPVNHYDRAYDDSQHASKTISSIKIRCCYCIELLSITYSDGITSTKHGGGGHVGAEYEFTLAKDEHITEMLIWVRGEWLYGLQFITSTGRCSTQYGMHFGPPIVARCKGGVLVGFLSYTKLHPEHKELYHNVRGIWRRDLVPRVPKEDDIYSEYFGDANQNGQAFNDRVMIENSTSIRISSVEVWSAEWVDSIRFHYIDIVDGYECKSSTMRRGGPGGPHHQFTLEEGEHIVTVSGRYEASCIIQLCFGTNRGRTSEVYGGGKGQPFSALAPRDKDGNYFRLQYICGKSNEASLTGVMFVWTPC
ncbi:HEAT repeat-containing protein 1 homolog [Drosophila melanogaster] [Rhizoctonia solani]|uniref:HEAT repeat-containing protein 1 homolog [Drosophila melanogaster] n=1 Tax=Rhizoctonia solani TaxID=456999 RepID=A0A0K6FU08_9AGAM|nr:HEAT repeat-containing protein 1 homolog [Drosophila melanogaster] [Rhizoctonia solani]